MTAIERTGIVLAGGRGERMGGAYKPLVPFRGRPLVAWSLDALRPLVDEVLIACGPAANAALLAPVVGEARIVPDAAEGPLGGLVAAARVAKGEWLLVAPADSPFLAPEVYATLLGAARGREGAHFVQDGHAQALVAAYRRDAILRASEGARSVRDAAARMDVARVEAAGALGLALRDVDTPEDLARAAAREQP